MKKMIFLGSPTPGMKKFAELLADGVPAPEAAKMAVDWIGKRVKMGDYCDLTSSAQKRVVIKSSEGRVVA